jgi:hypothetical protein
VGIRWDGLIRQFTVENIAYCTPRFCPWICLYVSNGNRSPSPEVFIRPFPLRVLFGREGDVGAMFATFKMVVDQERFAIRAAAVARFVVLERDCFPHIRTTRPRDLYACFKPQNHGDSIGDGHIC